MAAPSAGGIEIVWEEPPEAAKPPTQWEPIIEALKGKPNEWARVRECKTPSVAYNSRKGLRKVAGETIETAIAKQPDGTAKLYARWVPGTK